MVDSWLWREEACNRAAVQSSRTSFRHGPQAGRQAGGPGDQANPSPITTASLLVFL